MPTQAALGTLSGGTNTTTRSVKAAPVDQMGLGGSAVKEVPHPNPMDIRDEQTGIPKMFLRSFTESKGSDKASNVHRKGKPTHGKPTSRGKRKNRNSKLEIEICPHWSKKRCPKKDKCTYHHWTDPNTDPKPTSSKSCPTEKQQGSHLSKGVLTSSTSLPLAAARHPIAKPVPRLDENEAWPLTSTNPGLGKVISDEMGVPKMNTIDEHDS